MQPIQSFEQWLDIVKDQEPFLLFVKTNNCSVCESLLPQIEPLIHDFTFPFYLVNAAEIPEMAGQLSLFTAPVILLYKDGKEYTRFARFIQMKELIKRMEELTKWGTEDD